MEPFRRHSQVWLALLAAHLVVAVPSLCMAGLLKHPCECESATEDCCSDERGSDCTPDGCSHDDCENDPCQTQLTSASERPGRTDLDPAVEGLDPLVPLPLSFPGATFEIDLVARPGYTSLGPPGVRKRIPYHCADIPLLR